MAPVLVESDLIGTLFQMEGRSAGRHVSSGIYAIMEELYPDRFKGDPIDEIRAMLGNALEHTIVNEIATKYPDRYARPGELEFDGVYGTPDLWDLKEWAAIELKLTWASARRAEDIEDAWFWRYWVQLRCYAYMAGMTKGYLVICFVNGDYQYGTPGSAPQCMTWVDEWTPEELKETWDMVTQYV